MARTATGKVRVVVDLMEGSTALGVASATGTLRHLVDDIVEYASGTSDGQIDRVYSGTLSLTTTPTDVDLVGSLTSVLTGQTTTFVDLVGVLVVNQSTSGNVVVGNDTNGVPIFGAVTHTLSVPPGGLFLWRAGAAGLATTAGTGDILQLAASAGTVTAALVLWGRSA